MGDLFGDALVSFLTGTVTDTYVVCKSPLTPRAGTQPVRKMVLPDAAPVTSTFTCSWHCCTADIRHSWMAAAQLALFISWRSSRYGRMDSNPDLPLVGKKK
ncbi:hypothetical protein Taro_022546 [Colocasia esculenta]|uniref:Uncharacterized protein n=1 Tax=Colocasia esculenta TaxID=4460 RepID=A0A843V1M3_COLES|nr:hypothetical protein [Colocasia esculenta]